MWRRGSVTNQIMTHEPTTSSYSPIRFGRYSRPQVADLLGAIGLDLAYERGEGDYLFYHDPLKGEVAVLDMLGGFGAGLFGHNHPELVEVAQAVLAGKRPFLAQASVRAAAGELAAQLSDLVAETTGKSYITTLTNSGTEAVEAALKHAALEQKERGDGVLLQNRTAFKRLRMGVRDGEQRIPAALYRSAERLLGKDSLDCLGQLEESLTHHNEVIVGEQPTFLALTHAFHGKTSGSVQLTYNKEFRLPWQNLGVRSLFTPINESAGFEQMVLDEQRKTIHLVIDRGEIRLEQRPWSQIAAILIEPIQGEGGIHELTADFLKEVRLIADRARIPLIIDEIQSGMGRTGQFLASAQIRGDIYLFSKSLGGSLAKIGAMLVEKERYIRPFGYLHTSTFADDRFSCEIALASLRILRRDRYALIERCGTVGHHLKQCLERLQLKYPDLLKSVRGRGLMLGIELAPLNRQNRSLLMNIASEQNLLAFLLCGYLLHEHQIRITPTISATNTIRIEPSAYITYEEIERFVLALGDGLRLIEEGNAGDFLRYLSQSVAPAGEPVPYSVPKVIDDEAPHVAIVSHFVEPEHLTHFDPSLGGLSAVECARLLEKVQSVLEPFVVDAQTIHGENGEPVRLTVIGIPYTAEQIAHRIQAGTADCVIAAIEQAVEMARDRGCIQVGLTGHCSIVTRNCTALVEDQIGLTSGNSLTAAAASDALHQVLREQGVPPEQTTVGIVGGIGNIGRVLALIEVEYADRIILVGRRGKRRLQKLADEIYASAVRQWEQGGELTGIARRLSSAVDLGATAVVSYQTMIDLLGDEAPIQISLDLADLRSCNGILTATNAPNPIVTAAHIAPVGPVVICDVAVPNDVAPEVGRLRPDIRVIRGGILQLPHEQALDIRGLILPRGQAYACVSETLLLGLAEIGEPFSYGDLRPERVGEIGRLAKEFGFQVLAKQ